MTNQTYKNFLSACCGANVIVVQRQVDAAIVHMCAACRSEVSSQSVVWLPFDSVMLVAAGCTHTVYMDNLYDDLLHLYRLWIEEEQVANCFVIDDFVSHKVRVMPHFPIAGAYFTKSIEGRFNNGDGGPILLPRYGRASISVTNHSLHALRFRAVCLCGKADTKSGNTHQDRVDSFQTKLTESVSFVPGASKPCYICTSPTTEKLVCLKCQRV